MESMVKLSVVIITYNEEKSIEKCLASVAGVADDILVVDSGSTDKTEEICKAFGAQFIHNAFITHAQQKNFAISKAQQDWILLLDADEQIEPSLKNKIKVVISHPLLFDAYRINRQNFFMDKKIGYSGWQNDNVIRLFRKDVCHYDQKLVHEELITEGKVGVLEEKIIHHTYKGLSQYLLKLDYYTTLSAYDQLNSTRKISLYHLALKPFFRFLKHYLFNLGFLDGKVGFIIASFSAYSIFLRYLKMWRIMKGENLINNPIIAGAIKN